MIHLPRHQHQVSQGKKETLQFDELGRDSIASWSLLSVMAFGTLSPEEKKRFSNPASPLAKLIKLQLRFAVSLFVSMVIVCSIFDKTERAPTCFNGPINTSQIGRRHQSHQCRLSVFPSSVSAVLAQVTSASSLRAGAPNRPR